MKRKYNLHYDSKAVKNVFRRRNPRATTVHLRCESTNIAIHPIQYLIAALYIDEEPAKCGWDYPEFRRKNSVVMKI